MFVRQIVFFCCVWHCHFVRRHNFCEVRTPFLDPWFLWKKSFFFFLPHFFSEKEVLSAFACLCRSLFPFNWCVVPVTWNYAKFTEGGSTTLGNMSKTRKPEMPLWSIQRCRPQPSSENHAITAEQILSDYVGSSHTWKMAAALLTWPNVSHQFKHNSENQWELLILQRGSECSCLSQDGTGCLAAYICDIV